MTTVTTPYNIHRFSVLSLRGQMRLLHVGMISRGLNKTKALKTAGGITGRKYKRGDMETAITDLSAWLDENQWEAE